MQWPQKAPELQGPQLPLSLPPQGPAAHEPLQASLRLPPQGQAALPQGQAALQQRDLALQALAPQDPAALKAPPGYRCC